MNSQELAASQGLCSMSSVSSLIRALNNEWALYLVLSGLLNSTVNSLYYTASDYRIFRECSGKLVAGNSHDAISDIVLVFPWRA